MTIREATIADVPQLVAMGERFRSSTSYASSLAENPDQMAETATSFIEQPSSVVFVSEGRGGELTGMIGLVVHVHFISGVRTASEAFWWSEVAGHGIRLFHAGREWARAQGAVKLQMIQPLDQDQLGDVYRKLGFRPIEVGWELDVTAREVAA